MSEDSPKVAKKMKFTNKEEEKIIDFVKTNEILFNTKHKNFRDSEKKNRLWLRLANDLNRDGKHVCFFYLSL